MRPPYFDLHDPSKIACDAEVDEPLNTSWAIGPVYMFSGELIVATFSRIEGPVMTKHHIRWKMIELLSINRYCSSITADYNRDLGDCFLRTSHIHHKVKQSMLGWSLGQPAAGNVLDVTGLNGGDGDDLNELDARKGLLNKPGNSMLLIAPAILFVLKLLEVESCPERDNCVLLAVGEATLLPALAEPDTIAPVSVTVTLYV